MSSTDCLIVKVVEVNTDTQDTEDTEDKKIVNILYIFYDINEQQFFVRGKRFHEGSNYNPYSFIANDVTSLDSFIDVITLNDSDIIYELINYNNLEYESHDITFDYLAENESPENKLSSFYPDKYSSRTFKKILSVIQNLYNYY